MDVAVCIINIGRILLSLNWDTQEAMMFVSLEFLLYYTLLLVQHRLAFNSTPVYSLQTAKLQIATQNIVDHPEDPVCASTVIELKQL